MWTYVEASSETFPARDWPMLFSVASTFLQVEPRKAGEGNERSLQNILDQDTLVEAARASFYHIEN